MFLLALVTHPARTKLAVLFVGGAYVVPDDTVKLRAARMGLVAAAAVVMYEPAKPFIELLDDVVDYLKQSAGLFKDTVTGLKKTLRFARLNDAAVGTLTKTILNITQQENYVPGADPQELQILEKLMTYHLRPNAVTDDDIAYAKPKVVHRFIMTMLAMFEGWWRDAKERQKENTSTERDKWFSDNTNEDYLQIRKLYMDTTNKGENGRGAGKFLDGKTVWPYSEESYEI